MTRLDLESCLCSPAGFGLESATFLQRAIARITDSIPLDDLLARATEHERRCLEAAIGCSPGRLPVGVPPIELVDMRPVRTGKSLELAALAVTRSQTVDVSLWRPGQEPPRVSILATSTDNANAVRGHLGMVNERAALHALKIGETADSVTLRHPSGCPIEIRVVAAHRGGYSLASRWSASVFFDEAPGWYSTDRIVSLEDSRDQALGRLLPGAQAIYAGSKWQPSGFCFDTHAKHFGSPTPELVVISPQEVDGVSPAMQLNPAYWTGERVERTRRQSPRTFTMHVQNLFGGSGNSAFTWDEIRDSFVTELPPGTLCGEWFCALDASGLMHDSFAALFGFYAFPAAEPVRKRNVALPSSGLLSDTFVGYAVDDQGAPIFEPQIAGPLLRIAEVIGWEPPNRANMADIVAVLASRCHARGIRTVFGDQFEAAGLAGLFSQRGIRTRKYDWTSESKTQAIAGTLRRMFREKSISIVPHERMQRDLLSIREIPVAGGERWHYPTHGKDYASALITLCHALNDPDIVGAGNSDGWAKIDGLPTRAFRSGRYVAD